jgi:hypothetical protein
MLGSNIIKENSTVFIMEVSVRLNSETPFCDFFLNS